MENQPSNFDGIDGNKKPGYLYNILGKDEIDKIKEYIEKNKIGIDQSKIPGQVLNTEELGVLMKNIATLEKFVNFAENYPNDNPSNLIKDFSRWIDELELALIKIKSLIDESRDSADLSSMIRFIDQRRFTEDFINDAKRKINEIQNEN